MSNVQSKLEDLFKNIYGSENLDPKDYNHHLRKFWNEYKDFREGYSKYYSRDKSTKQVMKRMGRILEWIPGTKKKLDKAIERQDKKNAKIETEKHFRAIAENVAAILHLVYNYIPIRQNSFEDKKGHRVDALNTAREMATELQKLGQGSAVDTTPLGILIQFKIERNKFEEHTQRLIHSIGEFFIKEN